MIRNDGGLEVTLRGLGSMLRALKDTHAHRARYGGMYREFAGQAVEEVLKLWACIGEYTGLTAYLAEFGPPPPPDDEPGLPPANDTANGTPAGLSPPAAAPSA